MKVRRFQINTKHFGTLSILRPIPSETRDGNIMWVDPWGPLAPLRKYPDFATLIPVVSGDVMSHALHGRHQPLADTLRTEPEYMLLSIPSEFRECAMRSECLLYDARICQPHKDIPECWQCGGVAPPDRSAAAVVVHAWAEDRYVVIVEGDEFSL